MSNSYQSDNIDDGADNIDTEKLDRFNRTLKRTLSNTINLNNRLKKRSLYSNFILTYYSIFLIIYSLTGKYYSKYFDTDLSEYFSLILSIVLLVFSLINTNANYETRIQNSEYVISKLRKIRASLKASDLKNSDLDKNNDLYDNIIQNLENRTNGDFFKTLKSNCKQQGTNWIYLAFLKQHYCKDIELSKLKEHLCEINPFVEQFKFFLEGLMYIIILLTPILVFILCFILKN